MKSKLSLPLLELSFAAGIMVILSLPLLVNAQDHKEFNVNINNTDTIVNGKNIKELSAADRKDALKKLSDLNQHISITQQNDEPNGIVSARVNDKDAMVLTIDKNNSTGNGTKVMSYRIEKDGNNFSLRRDSNDRGAVIVTDRVINGQAMPRIAYDTRTITTDDNNSVRVYNYATGNRKNTQSFSYSSTDNDGVNTRVNFNVSDANEAMLKKISGVTKADLNLQDLNLMQSFSTGKTTLSFNLTDKAAATVQLKDSEGTVLWDAKTTGAEFSKSFALPKNGNYYLEVKQGGKVALRKISKEE